MNKYRIFSAVLFCLMSISVPASAKMRVKVKAVKPNIYYQTDLDTIECDVHGEDAAGCTSPRKDIKQIDIDCDKELITLSFGWARYYVQIKKEYLTQKIKFDHILKHELTHTALYQRSFENFYKPVSTAVLARYEKLRAEGKSCYASHSETMQFFYDMADKAFDRAHEQQKLMDGDENYDYQWKQTFQKIAKAGGKERKVYIPHKNSHELVNPEKTEAGTEQSSPQIARKPDVRVKVLKTRYAYHISKPEDVRFNNQGIPDENGTYLTRTLRTGVAFKMDRAGAGVNCRSGRVDVIVGYTADVSFNEDDYSSALYAYLKTNLTKRAQALDDYGAQLAFRIKEDIARLYTGLVNNDASCEDIKIRIDGQMAEYKKQLPEKIIRMDKKWGNAVPEWSAYYQKDMNWKTARNGVEWKTGTFFPRNEPALEPEQSITVADNRYAVETDKVVETPAVKEPVGGFFAGSRSLPDNSQTINETSEEDVSETFLTPFFRIKVKHKPENETPVKAEPEESEPVTAVAEENAPEKVKADFKVIADQLPQLIYDMFYRIFEEIKAKIIKAYNDYKNAEPSK